MPPTTMLLVVAMVVLDSAQAFLPTKLNHSDPQVISLLCPDAMVGLTWDHKAITREALRREVRRFFMENPPVEDLDAFYIPEDASLTQVFRAVYGPNSSPTRFIKAVNNIAWSNAMTEASGQMRYNAALHMDGETITRGHYLLQSRYLNLVAAINVDHDYSYGRHLLGTSLNAIQDFYSQTTWVELGRTGVAEGLGIPGMDIGDVAGPLDAVCSDCGNAVGECRDNVVPGSPLSSGYFEYSVPAALSYIVHKPTNITGKCSHGGSVDDSATKQAIGGINKESSSPCFSPHHYLHQQAVDLAIKASQYYLGYLRNAVGDDQFRRLLDLYQNSALSIVIDTTGSMAFEISAVKTEAQLIVERTDPELYILVPYNDPSYGPVTLTADPDEFLDELKLLDAFGGCCCVEEKFWHGLRLALDNTPDYSNIYCFTDAGANDAELMDGVIALATSKHCKITIIYSYNNGSRAEEGSLGSCNGDYVFSEVAEYEYLAAITGGAFIEINKFDVDEILGIMQDGVEESQASLSMRSSVRGLQVVPFPVDDSVSNFTVTISGDVTVAVLSHTSGVTFDLTNEEELEATTGVHVVSHTNELKSITFSNQSIGQWTLEADGGTTDYSLAISGSSTLSFLSEFCDLVTEPPRPTYRLIMGQPITGVAYYIEVTLVGYLESLVSSVTSLQLIDEAGGLFSTMEYAEDVDEHFYILSEKLPAVPFFVQVNGFLQTGTPFSRISPSMILAVNCAVELLLETSEMSARAGEQATAYFSVKNFGPEATFNYFATDELQYVSSWSPVKSTIPSMGSDTITVLFDVPSSAIAGTVSTVTVTASSELQENVNTAIAYFLVLPDHLDSEAPTCISNSEPSCADYSTPGSCSDGSWSVTGIMQDTISGLSIIYSRPENYLTVDDFSVGTTLPIAVNFSSSCCTRDVQIIGRDQQGNIGVCHWNLGALHGSVIEFVAESVGYTWVYLRWNMSDVPKDLSKYIININDDFVEESRCKELVCWKNVTYLNPCMLQTFSLTPYYLLDSLVEGAVLNTEATTLGDVPGAPTDPKTEYISTTSTTITWSEPVNKNCFQHYEICFTMIGATEDHCVISTINSYTMESLEACTVYHVTITSVSLLGLPSDPLTFDTNTDDAAPGAPENLHVNNQTTSWVELAWDNPLDRANCVKDWIITYTTGSSKMSVKPFITEAPSDNYATVSDLFACTNYTFWVSGVSVTGLQGSTKTTRTTLAEVDVTPLESVTIINVDANSISAMWTAALVEQCVDHYHVCVQDVVSFTEDCYDMNGRETVFTDLEACVQYEVTAMAVSPSGKPSPPKHTMATTGELPTSAPTDLQLIDVTAHSAIVTFGPPLENPNCANMYDILVISLEGSVDKKAMSIVSDVSTRQEHTLTGLEGCTRYMVRVKAVTLSGSVSPATSLNFTTIEETPSAPLEVQQARVTQNSVELHWFRPQESKLCAEAYRITWTSSTDSGSQDYLFPDHPANVWATVSGLTSCTLYTFSISAVTPLGNEGPPATYSTSTNC
ncbi:uncharacterized protein [Procambarus clarkii]|uniref:uncharacterized protein n=1 Tax=Procambarus clarkii TaxID=6728 RepID=UPI001E6707F2|nr:uncharacterized protein LOC123770687 [Procambarus clarkii]